MAITAEPAAKIERIYNARTMIRECMPFDQRRCCGKEIDTNSE